MAGSIFVSPDSGPTGRRLDGCHPQVRLILAGSEPVSDRWQGAVIQTAFWRIYQADGPGLSLAWDGGEADYPTVGAICIPGWLRFRFRWRERVVHSFVHFEPVGWTREQVEGCFRGPFAIADRELGRSLRRFGRSLRADGAWPPGLQLEAQSLACRGLAAAIARLAGPERLRLLPDERARFAAVIDMVEERLHRPLAVAELAAAAGMRPQPFIRAFGRVHGIPPNRYVLERRVARAGRMLLDGDAPLPEVARACGFPNRHYLTRVFGRAMGVGPAAYRAGRR